MQSLTNQTTILSKSSTEATYSQNMHKALKSLKVKVKVKFTLQQAKEGVEVQLHSSSNLGGR
jgi:hypothetical protein